MKILIVSDTHGSTANLKKAVKKEEPFDLMVHLGDIEGQEEQIRACTPYRVLMVRGNNDYFSYEPQERMVDAGPHKIFLTHGHRYMISLGTKLLRDEAAVRGADIVLYGHIHKPVLEDKGPVIAACPGSLTYPRQEGRKASYMILNIDRNGKTEFKTKYL